MKAPDMHPNEALRLSKLDALGMIYTPAEERFDRITRIARRVFDVPIALVTLVTEKCQWFKSAQGLKSTETPREISFCGHAILLEDTLVIPDTLENPDFADNPLVTGDPFIRFYAGHPLMYDGVPVGTICLIDVVRRHMTMEDLESLRSMAAWAENELNVAAMSDAQRDLVEARDEAVRASLVDPLTRVWNREGMNQLMDREFEQVKRDGKIGAFLFLDIDSYKAVNDTYGHAAGDVVLQEIAQRIRSSLRPYDVLARYGGDEFAVFASVDSKAFTRNLAERILERVREVPIEAGDDQISVTLSIGLCNADPESNARISQLLECADRAVYRAKESGRNRYAVGDSVGREAY